MTGQVNSRRALLLSGGSLLLAGAAPGHAATRREARSRARSSAAAAAAAASPAQTPLGPLNILAKSAIIVDYTSGAVLLQKDPDERMPPSSLTKMMTVFITYRELKAGKIKLDQTFTVSENAWRIQGSKMFVPLGEQVSVADLIQGIEVDSGNDAATVLAEGIGGTETAFVQMMNDTAKQLGMTNSHFMNPTGWPADDHYMSVRDIATLAAAIIRDFPAYYHFEGQKDFTFNKIHQENRNPLVRDGQGDGLKTGHTDAGGYSECGSAIRNGRRVIVVLNGLPTWNSRAQETPRLLSWAFENFQDVTLFAAGQPVEQVPVWLGTKPTVAAVSDTDLILTMPLDWKNHAKVSVAYTTPLNAPVVKGQEVGQLTVSGQGVPDMQVKLVAAEAVPRLSLPGRAVAVLTHYVTGV